MFLERFAHCNTGIRPALLNGDIKNKSRSAIVDAFQQPDLQSRVIVATIGTGAMGISLHDKDGRFPRYTFMSPSYSILNLHQAAGRTARSEAKSTAYVRMVYAKRYDQTSDNISIREQRILDALSRKKDLMKSILDQAVKDGIKFPGEYDIVADEVLTSMLDDNMQYMTDTGINGLNAEATAMILDRTAEYIPKPGLDAPRVVIFHG